MLHRLTFIFPVKKSCIDFLIYINSIFFVGLLTQLAGLNLKDNPLEFPPRNIIEQGPKVFQQIED